MGFGKSPGFGGLGVPGYLVGDPGTAKAASKRFNSCWVLCACSCALDRSGWRQPSENDQIAAN